MDRKTVQIRKDPKKLSGKALTIEKAVPLEKEAETTITTKKRVVSEIRRGKSRNITRWSNNGV